MESVSGERPMVVLSLRIGVTTQNGSSWYQNENNGTSGWRYDPVGGGPALSELEVELQLTTGETVLARITR
jgi:hypothetical protein